MLPKAAAKRGAKAAGLRYEARVAAAIPIAQHGQWFEFEDRNGMGWCQPDIIAKVLERQIIVLEVKYTWTMEGHRQLESLYLPVLEAAFGCRVWGMLIARRLLPVMAGIQVVAELGNGLEQIADGHRACLHWLGEGQILGSEICKPLESYALAS